MKPIIRWNIGNVSQQGWDCLYQSIQNTHLLYGDEVERWICFNTVRFSHPRLDVIGDEVDQLLEVTPENVPRSLHLHYPAAAHLSGWIFAPMQCDPPRRELVLDNDVILYKRNADIDAFLFGDEPFFLFNEQYFSYYSSYPPVKRRRHAYHDVADYVRDDLADNRQCNGGLVGYPEGEHWDWLIETIKVTGLDPTEVGSWDPLWEQGILGIMWVALPEERRRMLNYRTGLRPNSTESG